MLYSGVFHLYEGDQHPEGGKLGTTRRFLISTALVRGFLVVTPRWHTGNLGHTANTPTCTIMLGWQNSISQLSSFTLFKREKLTIWFADIFTVCFYVFQFLSFPVIHRRGVCSWKALCLLAKVPLSSCKRHQTLQSYDTGSGQPVPHPSSYLSERKSVEIDLHTFIFVCPYICFITNYCCKSSSVNTCCS